MQKDGLNDLIKKLDRIENHIGEEIAPSVNKLLKESVLVSLVAWYNDYKPKTYDRTYNFMKILDNTRASGKGNVIYMSVDSGSMNLYKGYSNKPLQPSTAFDFFFMNGEHGHGNWLMHTSTPPYLYVESDIYNGFGGRINDAINDAIGKILRK